MDLRGKVERGRVGGRASKLGVCLTVSVTSRK